MGPLPLYPNQPAGAPDINWNQVNAQQTRDTNEANYREDTNDRVRRAQMESDREYELKKKAADRDKERLAITKGQAAAEKWYQQQMVQINKDRLQQELQIAQMQRDEQARQFNVTSSGYLENGKPTLGREQFQDSSLQGWTDKALQLSRLPQDWVTLSRLQRGVSSNIGSIPGLNWAAGGQVGNTTMAGTPQSNSLQNTLGNIGVNVGGGGGVTPATGTGNWASAAAQQANAIATTPLNLRPDQQQIYRTAGEFAANPQGAAPGWLDSLDPSLRDEIQGAAEDQGYSWADVMARHNRSRWGSSGGAAAA